MCKSSHVLLKINNRKHRIYISDIDSVHHRAYKKRPKLPTYEILTQDQD